MSDPAGQYDPSVQQPAWGAGQPAPAGPGGRYVPPSLDEIWYKTTPNILLAIVTCGLWSAAWSYRTHDDLQKHNGDGLGGVVALILCVLGASLVVAFTVPMELEKAYTRNGWASPVKTMDGLWLLVPFAGPFIWYPKMQNALNAYWVSQGSRAAA